MQIPVPCNHKCTSKSSTQADERMLTIVILIPIMQLIFMTIIIFIASNLSYSLDILTCCVVPRYRATNTDNTLEMKLSIFAETQNQIGKVQKIINTQAIGIPLKTIVGQITETCVLPNSLSIFYRPKLIICLVPAIDSIIREVWLQVSTIHVMI